MALPRVKIIFENGALGASAPSPDGLLGLIFNAAAVEGKFELNKPYIISSFDEVSGVLGLTEDNNPRVVKLLREFFAEGEAGTQAYVMGVSTAVSMVDMLDYTKAANARRIIEVSKGVVRGIIASYIPAEGYEPEIADGLNADVYEAIAKGQELGEWATTQLFAPIFVAVEGRDYQGDPTLLRDLTEQTDNRVMVLIGDTTVGTNGAAMGLLAGRIAKMPVQRNIGRTKDGAVNSTTIFIDNVAAEQANVETLNDKGYVSFRTFVGRAGYFFTDDKLATLPTDDYKHLAYRRSIDKAYRIAYDTLLNELLDEIPVTAAGKILTTMTKHWEGLVVNAIASQMTANGELSSDPSDADDRGVICFVDPNQNVVSTGIIDVSVRVRPFGYSRYVDVYLGFQVLTE